MQSIKIHHTNNFTSQIENVLFKSKSLYEKHAKNFMSTEQEMHRLATHNAAVNCRCCKFDSFRSFYIKYSVIECQLLEQSA